MSLLLPSMGNARESARSAVCQNNMKQIGIGIELFKKNNKQRLPKAVMAVSTTWDSMGNYQAWKVLINPYMRQSETVSGATGDLLSTGSFSCPSRNVTNAYTGGYGWNCDYLAWDPVDQSTPGIPYVGVSFYRLIMPAETLIIGDTRDESSWLARVCRKPNGDLARIGNRHRGNTNVLWGDVHVSKENPIKMKNGKNGKQNYYYIGDKDNGT